MSRNPPPFPHCPFAFLTAFVLKERKKKKEEALPPPYFQVKKKRNPSVSPHLSSISASVMAILVLLALMLAMPGGSTANWCVCRSDVGDSALQKTLDYACGAGADCNPIHQNGVCYSPNTVRAHCSYAVNSFFQKKGQAQGTCDFASTATVVTTDPSTGGTCTYPSSASTAGTTPTSTTPSTGTLTPTTTTTGSTTPTTLGGISGMGPTGINADINGGFLPNADLISLFFLIFFSGQVLLRG